MRHANKNHHQENNLANDWDDRYADQQIAIVKMSSMERRASDSLQLCQELFGVLSTIYRLDYSIDPVFFLLTFTENPCTYLFSCMGDVNPSLFALACQEQWEEFISKLQGLCVSEKLSLKELRGIQDPTFSSEGSILHVVCAYQSVIPSVIETILIELGSDLASSMDASGQIPLHIAISFACHLDIIRPLVRASPSSAQNPDSYLMRPIDLLGQKIIMKEERSKYRSNNNHSISESEQSKTTNSDVDELWNCVHLLAVAMDTLSPSIDWDQPILHACLRASPIFPYALWERAMKRFKHQFQVADKFGNLPLHIAASLSPDDDVTTEGLKHIAREYPLAASMKNINEQLPLDLAIECERGWDNGIAELLEIYPAPDRFRIELAPRILALAAGRGRTTIVFQMLKARPDFFNWKQ